MNTCQQCQQSFPTPRRHPHQKYCSTTCRDIARNTCIDLPCSCCGKLVNRSRSRATQAHVYCSKACESILKKQIAPRGESHVQHVTPVTVPCDTCGVMLNRRPSEVRPHNFCNRLCQRTWQRESGYSTGANNGAWRGGYTDYRGPNWHKQSKAAQKRDNHTCQHCGSTSNLQVHHVIPYQTFGSYIDANNLGNLLTLCMTCHTTAEWQYRKDHPESTRLFPDTTRLHTCRRCGENYIARGPRSIWCEDCRHRNCEKCGKVFRIKNTNEVNKYCSRLCAGTSKSALSASGNP